MSKRRDAIVLELLRNDGEMYGLDLVQKSDGWLRRGTVYVRLNMMEDAGLITSRLETPRAGRLRRRLYRITSLGMAKLYARERVG
jgi:DNA-binding PadR family transcriptional regulator